MAERLSLMWLAAICAWPLAAVAQAPSQSTNEVLLGDNPLVGEKEEGKVQVNSRLVLDANVLTQPDLDEETADERWRIQPEARIDITYWPDDEVELFSSTEVGVDFEKDDGEWDRTERLEVRELFVLVDDFLAQDFQVQVGRQDVEDGREWLYDARLDGVRLAYDHRAWRVETMWGREELVRQNLLRTEEPRQVDTWLFHAEYEVTGDWDLAAYMIKQVDLSSRNLNPRTLGIQSEGRIGPFGHWLELANQSGSAGRRQLDARAIDLGLIWYFPLEVRPALFAGYARGSGGGNSQVDENFRQTGLQDNEDRITGLGNVRYYGEALDPDLSNIEIFTLGIGLRPRKSSSVELIAHNYRQVALDDDDIRGSPISAELDGESRDIGTEIDLAASVFFSRWSVLETKLGWFMPGEGFGEDAEDSVVVKIRLAFFL